MVKACIFDMDGTTVNTINSIAYFANRALNMYGLPSIDTERYKLLVGNGAKTLVKRMLDEVGAPESIYDTVLNEYNKSYDDDFLYLARPYDGIPELLKKLKKNGIKTAIVSNKPDSTARKISDTFFGKELIDICVGARENVPLKPDPAAVLEIIKKLGALPCECLYIGDTATDMLTGKNAGIYTVGVLWGFRSREEIEGAGACEVTDNPEDIFKKAAEE